MKARAYKTLSVVVISLVLHLGLTAQLNIKVGYSLGYALAPTNDQIISTYNVNNTNDPLFDDYIEMDRLGLMNGITLGFRYTTDVGAIELGWEQLGKTRSSTGFSVPLPPQQPTAYPYEVSYSANMFMLTYENRFGIYGVGSTIGYNYLTIKAPARNADENATIEKGNQLFARFHVSLNITGNTAVAIALKPFFQLPLSSISLQKFADHLSVESTNIDESFRYIGLSLVFYNGPQK